MTHMTVAGGVITAVTPAPGVTRAEAWRALSGLGTMATQNADAVAITGGAVNGLATLSTSGSSLRLSLTASAGVQVPDYTPVGNDPTAYFGNVSTGANRFNCFMNGTAPNFFNGPVLLARTTPVAGVPARALISYLHASTHGLVIAPGDADTGGALAQVFLNLAGGTVGTIACSASATSYNTSSDPRLKDDVQTLTDALATVQALRPVRFHWKADGTPGQGFLADEVQQIVPAAVTGTPDAVDEAGQILPMGIDMSKLVPYLVASINELAQRLAQAEARLTAAGA